jgi:hypothetical protein
VRCRLRPAAAPGSRHGLSRTGGAGQARGIAEGFRFTAQILAVALAGPARAGRIDLLVPNLRSGGSARLRRSRDARFFSNGGRRFICAATTCPTLLGRSLPLRHRIAGTDHSERFVSHR